PNPANVARPFAFVVAVALPTSAYPPGTDAVTTAPFCGTALLFASRSWIAGCAVNTAPLADGVLGGVVTVSWLAIPAVNVSCAEVAVSCPALKVTVPGPAGPLTPNPANVARPFAFVVAVALPTNVYPLGTEAVTATPA